MANAKDPANAMKLAHEVMDKMDLVNRSSFWVVQECASKKKGKAVVDTYLACMGALKSFESYLGGEVLTSLNRLGQLHYRLKKSNHPFAPLAKRIMEMGFEQYHRKRKLIKDEKKQLDKFKNQLAKVKHK